MTLFGFVDGFFFNSFLMLLLLCFGLYQLGKAAVKNPDLTLTWAKILHGFFKR